MQPSKLTGGGIPKTGGGVSKTGGDAPKAGSDVPETGSKVPEAGGNVPEAGSDTSGGDAPSSSNATPGCSNATPGSSHAASDISTILPAVPPPFRAPSRRWLWPLVPIYAGALAWKNDRFDRHRSIPKRLGRPVLSVGSLSAGGAGKTPFLVALAGLLRELGYAPDVLSRGYGRRTRGVLQVDVAGTAEEFGDEPLLLAQTLGCPVFVGADRSAAGLLAEACLPECEHAVHLLDDGFAHRRLHRDVDIVLVTSAELCDRLLPVGNLREPRTSLRRATVIVLRDGEAEALRPMLDRVLGPGYKTPVWTISRRLTLPATLPARPLVFCGIARPAGFAQSLQEAGVTPVATHTFRDHHRYQLRNAAALQREARRAQADGFITTSKDAVKLTPDFLHLLRQVGPVAVADVAVELQNRTRCAEELRSLLRTL